MTDTSDDDLRARLRAADPAAGLPPPSDRWIAELTEATMSAPHDTETRSPAEEPGPRRRSWRLWAMPAAAAVAVAAVGLTLVLTRGGGDNTTSADPGPTSSTTTSASPQPSTDPAVVSLTAGSAGAPGRCLPVSVQALERMPTAFDGVVTTMTGEVATIRVTRWYAGTPAQRAAEVVEVRGMSAQLRQLVYGVDLRPGARYLVTAARGQVTACGFSATWSPRLAALYAQAYPG